MKTLTFLSLCSVFLVIACGPKSASMDPTTYPITPADRVKVEVPPACKVAYENAIPKIAVVDFTNNTTFDLAKVTETYSAGRETRREIHGGVWGATGGSSGIGVGHVGGSAGSKEWSQHAQTVSRDINANLGKSVAEAVVSELANIGGMTIYTRRDLEKILQEQKLQMSGLVDPNTAVQVGRLAGVRYIVTGAINNINLKWIDVGEVRRGVAQHFGFFGSVASVGASTQEGWNLTVDIVVKVLDTETGEIIFSKRGTGREVLGKTPTFNYDSIIGAAKKASQEALEDMRPELSKLFPLRGYIIQLRTSPDGKERYALINVGSKNGVKEGQEFFVLDFQEVQDPITGRTICDQVKLPVSLVVSNQIQRDKAWTVAEGDKNQLMRVKLGQVVERKPIEKKGGIIKKLF